MAQIPTFRNGDISNVLAQLAPGATTETALYTVDSGSHARIDELVVCNRSAVAVSFRFAIVIGGAAPPGPNATQTKDYVYFDLPLLTNNTFSNEMGVTLNAFDEVRVYASTADLTFTLFGAVT